MRSHPFHQRLERRSPADSTPPRTRRSLRSILKDYAWLAAAVVLVAVALLVGLNLLPLALGAVFSYLLHPAADALERRGMKRAAAVALLVATGSFLLFASFIALVPALLAKAREFAEFLPQLSDTAIERFWPWIAPYATALGIDENSVRGAVFADTGTDLGDRIPSPERDAIGILNLFFLCALTPFVTFYMLRDWHLILRRARELIPRSSQATAVLLAARIERRLSGFIRGQTLICVLQGLWHITGYSLIGVKGAVPLGIAMGVSNYIPYIGNALVLIAVLGVTAVQFDAAWPMGAVLGLYVVSQLAEDGVLYPKIVGDRIKLHPVWVIAVLLTAGGLFGFVGALLAIPVTCVLEVLIAHAVERYKQTSYYREP